ncbi:hypothetical protein O185_26465 [Photorhabdus temperata J3]|uniref:Type VI secretion system baseplate subunit TssF n=1 Tax=Photorhabdus temperata J3 TaxID=1389415 RepID=U7QQQ8_PHOTE|nr:hypothetical protein O185_26465 [Photorhabdus temperata J3]
MDDLILRYYEAEMRYLREAGKEFAKAYPDRAAMLNLDRVGTRDPYVERLFEGLPDPFSDDVDARMYRTEDLARYLPDGNLVYLE